MDEHVRRVPEVEKTRRVLTSRQHRHRDAIAAKRLSSASTYTTQKQRKPSTKSSVQKQKQKHARIPQMPGVDPKTWNFHVRPDGTKPLPPLPREIALEVIFNDFHYLAKKCDFERKQKAAFPLDDTVKQCS